MSFFSDIGDFATKIVKGIGKGAKKIGLPTTTKDLLKTVGGGLLTGGLAPALGINVPIFGELAEKTGLTNLLEKAGISKLASQLGGAGLFDWGKIITGGGTSGDLVGTNVLPQLLTSLLGGGTTGGTTTGDTSALLAQLMQQPRLNWAPLIGMGALSAYLTKPYIQQQQSSLDQMINSLNQLQNILSTIAAPQAQKTANIQNQLLSLLQGRLPQR